VCFSFYIEAAKINVELRFKKCIRKRKKGTIRLVVVEARAKWWQVLRPGYYGSAIGLKDAFMPGLAGSKNIKTSKLQFLKASVVRS
jgi:hypothetical protein